MAFDKVLGMVHAVTKGGKALCGTVGKKLKGTTTYSKVSCLKCRKVVRGAKMKPDDKGMFPDVSPEQRDEAMYGKDVKSLNE